jgi:tetrahydromethanopterin S-methyltransferase subunit A
MNRVDTKRPGQRIAAEMRTATDAAKCHPCGCFHGALERLSEALSALPSADQEHLRPVLKTGSERLLTENYECLGCSVCWPANALNLAADVFPDVTISAHSACTTEAPARGVAWPPLPGDYQVFDAAGSIAVCVLTSGSLTEALAHARPDGVAIVGTLFTENLGIERLITNVLANPNITTLVICGADSEQRIGHLPGHTLLSLVTHGMDKRGRIIRAKGRRPVLRNLSTDVVDIFRREIAVCDHVGEEDVTAVRDAIASVPMRNGLSRGPSPRAMGRPAAQQAQPATRLILDPHGYFIVFPDRKRRTIRVEHYTKDGTLAHVFTGGRAEHLYTTIIARDLVSRLDHAAYLGKELDRAELALETGAPYVQDQAPEPQCDDGCGCDPSPDSEGA